MERFTGIIGILLIFGIALLLSNNRKAINLRLIFSGLALQITIAFFVLKVSFITHFFELIGKGMSKIEQFATQGASFVYGGIMVDNHQGSALSYGMQQTFVFAFSVTATIILVCVLVAILYHIGIMQRIISVIAKVMNVVMRASGAEALSNVASAFVGQVEAQVLIRPYLSSMTKSELLSSMSGSMACIAGGILIVYVNMGAKAEYLLAASLMAAPAALVISKIILPETEESVTKGKVKLEVKKEHTNLIDAISHGDENIHQCYCHANRFYWINCFNKLWFRKNISRTFFRLHLWKIILSNGLEYGCSLSRRSTSSNINGTKIINQRVCCF